MKLSPMLKKFKDKGKMPLIIAIICSVAGMLILTIMCLIVAFIIEAANPEKEAVAFDSYSSENNYSYIEPYIMSDYFGSMVSNENHNLYFVLTEDNYAFVVCMDQRELGKCQNVIDWTYDSTGLIEHPGDFYIKGYPKAIDDEMEELIIENFNYFWGEDIVNSDNVYEYFGGYYLDTTVSDSAYDSVGLVLIFALLAAIFVITFFAAKRSRCNTNNKITKRLNVTEDCLARTDAEINANEVKYFSGTKVYLTSEHFVCVKEGLLAIPYSAICNVENAKLNKNAGCLRIVLKDGQRLVVAVSQVKNQAYGELEAIVAELRNYVEMPEAENIMYGSDVNMEMPANNFETGVENKFLGSLAALGGAVLGGIVFMVLWQIGYISSISGIVGIIVAALLYQKAAKNISIYGYVYCMVTSTLALFVAAILSYSIMIASELGESFISVLTNIFNYMSAYSLWGGFWIDFLFGAAFSLIWFLVKIFKK